MRAILLSLTSIIFAAGFTLSSQAFAHGGHPDEHVIFSGNRHAHIFWETAPSVGAESVMRIEFVDGTTDAPIALNDQLGVELWMPDMGHGSSPTKIVAVTDGQGRALAGVYRISKMYFVMAGSWDVRLHLTAADGTSQMKAFSVDVN